MIEKNTSLLEKTESTKKATLIEVTGLGQVEGWENPGPDCTAWELMHGIDVLGPEYVPYNYHAERIILDVDDNIRTTGPFWTPAHRDVFMNDFGFTAEEASDEVILAHSGNINLADALGIERFVKDGKQYTAQEVWDLIKTRAREIMAPIPMDPLIVLAIKEAKRQGVHLAEWSSSSRGPLTDAAKLNGYEDDLDAIVSVDDVNVAKPDPEGYFKAIRATDEARGYLQPGENYSEDKPFDPNGAWMVGDSPNDVKGGKAAGVSTLWVEHPFMAHANVEKRRKKFEEARSAGATALKQAARELMPSGSIRTYNPQEAGYFGELSITDMDRDEVKDLQADFSQLARFLIDPHMRAALYRAERVYDALKAQGLGDKEPQLRGVLAETGFYRKSDPAERERVSPEVLLERMKQEIDENFMGY